MDWAYVGAGIAAVGLFFWRRWYRWGTGTAQLSVLSPVGGLAMGMVMLGMSRLGGQAAAWLFGIDLARAAGAAMSLADSGPLQLGSYAAQGFVVAAFAWLVFRAARYSKHVKRFWIIKAVGMGVVALLLFWPMVNGVSVLASIVSELLTNEAPKAIAHNILAQLVDSPVDGWFVLMVALVLVVAPVFEEVLYRGILQQALVSAGVTRWPAILTISALFAVVHLGAVPFYALPPLFVLSIGFGWVYEKTGRLSASIIMHAAFNLVNLLLAWLTVG